jgi:ubiquinone biosynthesis protein UbiJ
MSKAKKKQPQGLKVAMMARQIRKLLKDVDSLRRRIESFERRASDS